jgi:hypothetical protein
MRVGLMTREYPPYVYGGAGVHVEYLSQQLAQLIDVDVYAWGETPASKQAPPDDKDAATRQAEKEEAGLDRLTVHFQQPWAAISGGTTAKFKGALAEPAGEPGPERARSGAHAYLVCVHGGVPGEEAVRDSVCAHHPLSGTAARVEG